MEASWELQLVESMLHQHQMYCVNIQNPLVLYVLDTLHSIGLLSQFCGNQLFSIQWLYLPNQLVKSLQLYTEQIVKIIINGRTHSTQFSTAESSVIVLPMDLTKNTKLSQQAMY